MFMKAALVHFSSVPLKHQVAFLQHRRNSVTDGADEAV